MKKKSAKQVPLPDITATSAADFAARKQSSLGALTANRADQKNPFGSIDWDRDPVTGAWTQTEAYNPGQQALYDTELTNKGTMGKLAGGLLGEMDLHYMGAPKAPTAGGANQQALDTIRALQAPDLQRRRAAKEAQMAATYGGTGTGAGWNTEQQNINDAESRADLQAINQSFATGRGIFADDTTARNTYTGEQDRMLKSAGGMMTGAAPEDLKFGSYAQQAPVTAPNTTENAMAMWKMQQDAANAKAAAKKGGMMGGLGTLAGGAIGAYYGGPAGAQAGASIGGAAGGMFDK